MSERVPRAARWILRAAARLVPGHRRGPWRRQWEAELEHRCSGDGPGEGVLRFALGSVAHALYMRREEMRMMGWAADLRHSARALLRRPGFTALSVATLLLTFDSMGAACAAVEAILAEGFVPAALEILDQHAVHAVEDSVFRAGYPRDAAAVLLVEVDGTQQEVDEAVAWIASQVTCAGLRRARDDAEREALWRGRKGAFGAMGRFSDECYVMDCVVPRAHMAEALERIDAIAAEAGLKCINVFHAGDGNLHPLIAYARDEADRVEAAGRAIAEACVSLGGSLTGEHGIGIEKRDFMPLLFDAASLGVMESVRAAFDPRRLMNPGKVLPGPKVCAEAILRKEAERVV